MSHWLLGTPFNAALYPLPYRPLIVDQDTIGWNQFFQGRISIKWASLQQVHLWDLPPIKGHDGTHWSPSILGHIFTKWNLLWDTHNKDLHGIDIKAKANVDVDDNNDDDVEKLVLTQKEFICRLASLTSGTFFPGNVRVGPAGHVAVRVGGVAT